jgi:hypothetical protein
VHWLLLLFRFLLTAEQHCSLPLLLEKHFQLAHILALKLLFPERVVFVWYTDALLDLTLL